MNGASARSTRYPVVLPTPAPVGATRWVVGAAVALVVVAAFWMSLSGDHIVNWGGWTLTRRFIVAALTPAHDSAILLLTLKSAFVTVGFALCGSVVSVCIGTVGGVLASEAWWEVWTAKLRRVRARGTWYATLIRLCIAVPRGVHELVWGLFFINILGLDPLVAVLAIGIPFGATTAKVFAETMDEIPRETALRFRAGGASTLVAFTYGILPKALPLLVSYALYRLECAIRSAAVLGLIGAGGLGCELMMSLQSLRYDQVWTFLYALMVLVALTDWGSTRLTRALTSVAGTTSAQTKRQTRTLALGILVGALMLTASYVFLGLDVVRLFEAQRLDRLSGVVASAMPPHFVPGELPELAMLSLETLAMSITAMVIAGPAAVVASWFSSMALFKVTEGADRDSRRIGSVLTRLFTTAIRFGLVGMRALSDGIWVLLALSIFFPGTFAGAFALAAYNFGVMGRLLSQINENTDTKSFRALRAQGASLGRAILYGHLPLTLPKYLSYMLYRWEVCLRATVVVGIVGAGGLGLRLEEQLASFDYRGVAATLVFFITITLVVDVVSSSGRRALRAA